MDISSVISTYIYDYHQCPFLKQKRKLSLELIFYVTLATISQDDWFVFSLDVLVLRFKVAIHSFTTYTLFRGNQTHNYYNSSIACGTPRHQETIES